MLLKQDVNKKECYVLFLMKQEIQLNVKNDWSYFLIGSLTHDQVGKAQRWPHPLVYRSKDHSELIPWKEKKYL